MTTGPRLVPLGRRLVPGVLALGLFGVLALVVVGTNFGEFASFEDVSVTSAIGYALFDFETLQQREGVPGTEPFLIAFLLIAVVLDAALDASLVLAKREDDERPARPASFGPPSDASPGGDAATDGGRDRVGEERHGAGDGTSDGGRTDGHRAGDGTSDGGRTDGHGAGDGTSDTGPTDDRGGDDR